MQIITSIVLLALLLIARPNKPLLVMVGNYFASLAVCGAMDMGWLGRDMATTAMMAIDMCSALLLIGGSVFAVVMAATLAVSSSLHALNLGFGATLDTTFALVYVVNVVQLGVLAVGSFGGGGGGLRAGSDPHALYPTKLAADAGLAKGGLRLAVKKGD